MAAAGAAEVLKQVLLTAAVPCFNQPHTQHTRNRPPACIVCTSPTAAPATLHTHHTNAPHPHDTTHVCCSTPTHTPPTLKRRTTTQHAHHPASQHATHAPADNYYDLTQLRTVCEVIVAVSGACVEGWGLFGVHLRACLWHPVTSHTHSRHRRHTRPKPPPPTHRKHTHLEVFCAQRQHVLELLRGIL